MEWYFIILIVIAGLVFLWFSIKLISKPKFNKIEREISSHVDSKLNTKKEIGLSFDDKFNKSENLYSDINIPTKRKFAPIDTYREKEFEKIRAKINQQKKEKSLAQQIKELPPALQMLLFDRGLAKKEYDFKSKKS